MCLTGCRSTYRQTTKWRCCSTSRVSLFPQCGLACQLVVAWLVANMGSLLSALSSWRPTLGAGTYTILGDTNGLFERYLTEPGTSSSSVPSLTELPSLIVAQLLPEIALGSKGPARRIPDAPRLSPQLASRKKRSKTNVVYYYLIRSRRQCRLFIGAVDLHGGGVRRCRHHFCEDFQVGG